MPLDKVRAKYEWGKLFVCLESFGGSSLFVVPVGFYWAQYPTINLHVNDTGDTSKPSWGGHSCTCEQSVLSFTLFARFREENRRQIFKEKIAADDGFLKS